MLLHLHDITLSYKFFNPYEISVKSESIIHSTYVELSFLNMVTYILYNYLKIILYTDRQTVFYINVWVDQHYLAVSREFVMKGRRRLQLSIVNILRHLIRSNSAIAAQQLLHIIFRYSHKLHIILIDMYTSTEHSRQFYVEYYVLR